MPNEENVQTDDRRLGPSRLSTWSGRRVGALWLLWPGAVIAVCVVIVAMRVRADHGFSDVRVDLTRSNLIGLGVALIGPPLCLTLLWSRMRGRRRQPAPHTPEHIDERRRRDS